LSSKVALANDRATVIFPVAVNGTDCAIPVDGKLPMTETSIITKMTPIIGTRLFIVFVPAFPMSLLRHRHSLSLSARTAVKSYQDS
jgi:hypothetical protein